MINREDLVEIAQLAKISLSSDDAESMAETLSDIMSLVDTINDADLSQYDCSDETVFSDFREDIVKPSLPVDLVLSGAAGTRDDFFTV